MGVGSNSATTGKPTFNNVTTTQTDLQAAADFTEATGNYRIGTTAERTAPALPVRNGLRFFDTTDSTEYLYLGGWVSQGSISAFAVKTVAQNLTTGIGTVITWDTVDLLGGITHSAGAFTVPKTGWYRVTGWADTLAGGGTDRWHYVGKNGGGLGTTNAQAASTSSLAGSGLWSFSIPEKLTAGDVLRYNSLQNSGATQTLTKATFGIEFLR